MLAQTRSVSAMHALVFPPTALVHPLSCCFLAAARRQSRSLMPCATGHRGLLGEMRQRLLDVVACAGSGTRARLPDGRRGQVADPTGADWHETLMGQYARLRRPRGTQAAPQAHGWPPEDGGARARSDDRLGCFLHPQPRSARRQLSTQRRDQVAGHVLKARHLRLSYRGFVPVSVPASIAPDS